MPFECAEGTLSVHATLDAAEAGWRDLWNRSSGYAFQSFDWFAAWQRHLGARHGWRPCIVELRDRAGTPRWLLPLGWRREGPLRVLSFLGGDLTDYHAPLVDTAFLQGLDEDRCARLWDDILACLPATDLLRLRRMPGLLADGSPNPLARLPRAASHEQAHAALLPESFDAFRKARAAALFADTRRQLRRLREQGEVRIAVEVPADARDAAIAALAAQKSRRWQDTGAPDAFAGPGFLDFYRALTGTPLQGSEAVVSALYLDGVPIATHWGLRSPQRFYWLMPAYDAQWARFSPGRLLMEAVIQRCIDDRIAVFDLTVGDEPYKLQWADIHMPMFDLLQARSLRGRLAVAALRLRARARDMPALRTAVRRLRALLANRRR